MNEAYLRFLGVSNADVRGYDWAQFVHPDDRKAYVASYLEVVVKRRLFEATFRFRRHDGEYRRMKSVGTACLGTDGGFLWYVGSTVDITDVPAPDDHGPLASRQAGQTDTAKAVEGYPIGDQTEDPQSRQPPAPVESKRRLRLPPAFQASSSLACRCKPEARTRRR